MAELLSHDPQIGSRVTKRHKAMLHALVDVLDSRRPTVREVLENLIEAEYRRRFGDKEPALD